MKDAALKEATAQTLKKMKEIDLRFQIQSVANSLELYKEKTAADHFNTERQKPRTPKYPPAVV